MVKAKSFTAAGNSHQAEVVLGKDVFGLEPNHQLLDLAYRSYLASRRTSGASVLTRGKVRGGGKKPWRQKGTGRARVGSIRVPQWRGGGVVFGPTGQENHNLKMPAKMKRLALRQALSLQAADKKVILIDDFDAHAGKVKNTVELLSKLDVTGRIVLVTDKMTAMIDRATRNIANLDTVEVRYLNVFTVLNADWLILTKKALTELQGADEEATKAKEQDES